MLANAHAEVFLTKLNFTRGFHGEFLGGRPALAIPVPVADGTLEFDSNVPGAQRRVKDSRTGPGYSPWRPAFAGTGSRSCSI